MCTEHPSVPNRTPEHTPSVNVPRADLDALAELVRAARDAAIVGDDAHAGRLLIEIRDTLAGWTR